MRRLWRMTTTTGFMVLALLPVAAAVAPVTSVAAGASLVVAPASPPLPPADAPAPAWRLASFAESGILVLVGTSLLGLAAIVRKVENGKPKGTLQG